MSWVKAVVLYDYVPDDPSDDDPSSTSTSSTPLTLHVGDVLQVVEEPGNPWWWGQKTDATDNRTGLIPANYVHVYTPAELQTQNDGGKDPTLEKSTVPEEDSGSEYEEIHLTTQVHSHPHSYPQTLLPTLLLPSLLPSFLYPHSCRLERSTPRASVWSRRASS